PWDRRPWRARRSCLRDHATPQARREISRASASTRRATGLVSAWSWRGGTSTRGRAGGVGEGGGAGGAGRGGGGGGAPRGGGGGADPAPAEDRAPLVGAVMEERPLDHLAEVAGGQHLVGPGPGVAEAGAEPLGDLGRALELGAGHLLGELEEPGEREVGPRR